MNTVACVPSRTSQQVTVNILGATKQGKCRSLENTATKVILLNFSQPIILLLSYLTKTGQSYGPNCSADKLRATNASEQNECSRNTLNASETEHPYWSEFLVVPSHICAKSNRPSGHYFITLGLADFVQRVGYSSFAGNVLNPSG